MTGIPCVNLKQVSATEGKGKEDDNQVHRPVHLIVCKPKLYYLLVHGVQLNNCICIEM